LVHRAWEGNDGIDLSANCEGEQLSMKRTKRSIHQHHHRPRPDHEEEHHIRSHDRHHHHHHASAMKQMEELKSEILFENFIKKYERRYLNDDEQSLRMRIFKRNLHKIEMLNKHEQGTAKYGITEFADMTEKEYLRRTGLIVPENHENNLGNPIADIPDVPLPESFDWRDKAAVTDVKNQGNCGSCWSFSVTGNIEGLHAIKTGQLEAYSEQELLDCDTKDNACNGGYMDDAFKAIEQIGGLELEDEYPYMAKKQKKCLFNQTLSHVKVKGVVGEF
jgi:cathepsin F